MVMVALYRPGPISQIPEYIKRKHNPKLTKYLDPRMEKFLGPSYGLIVYQDDLLFCALDSQVIHGRRQTSLERLLVRKFLRKWRPEGKIYKRDCY